MNIVRFLPIAVVLAAVVIWVNLEAEAIHFPLLVSMLSGIVIGGLVPVRGWILAIVQLLVILLFYVIITVQYGSLVVNSGIFQFTTLFSILTILSGSFLGSFFRKTLQS